MVPDQAAHDNRPRKFERSQPVLIDYGYSHRMLGGMMVAGLMVNANMTVESNPYNFVEVPSAVLAESRGASEWEVKVDLAHPAKTFVPSWTGKLVGHSSVKVWVKPDTQGSTWFCLGIWSQDGQRTSVNGQQLKLGSVDTDTLSLNEPVTRLDVRLEGYPKGNPLPELDTLTIVADGDPAPVRNGNNQPIEPLAVPQRCQGDYPGGGVLCSPTSVSMILAYWAAKLDRPILDHDVPVVQKGVYDPAWKGTGNWPFNVAYAGSQPGMTGCVTRFRGIGDLEEWVGEGVPVACSVSYALLKGKDKVAPNDGHLVVVVGFDANGDPVFNDPGRHEVRWTYKRSDFQRAWEHSSRTVYLVYPRIWRTPLDGPWPSGLGASL